MKWEEGLLIGLVGLIIATFQSGTYTPPKRRNGGASHFGKTHRSRDFVGIPRGSTVI